MTAARLGSLSGALVVLALCWLVPPDEAARDRLDEGTARALASFATARALNSVISVAQGTEVAVQPGGVGVVLTPGQALDPLNDLVEQFSELMLLASASFAAQRVLLEIGAWWPVSLALTLVVAAWAVMPWRSRQAPSWLTRLLVVVLLGRFAVALATLGSHLAFELFMADDHAAAQAAMEEAGGSAERDAPAPPAGAQPPIDEERSVWERLRDILDKDAQGIDITAEVDSLRERADRVVMQVVRLIAVFLLQTLVMPLLIFWFLSWLARTVLLPAAARAP